VDAPLYPPAKTFHQPKRLPWRLSSHDTPIATLKANPTAWAIVEKEIPGMDRRIGADALKPHLGNFSLASLLVFGVVPKDALDRIDQQFATLGEFQ